MKRSRILLIAVGLVIVVSVCAGLWINRETHQQLPEYPQVQVVIGGETFTLLIAQSSRESELGLGAVPILPKYYGMLFSGSGQMGIWMKGMAYAIDIVWLDKDGKVVHIVHDAKPSSYPETTYMNPIGTDARKVVEIGSGETRRLGVEIGSLVLIQ